ncbi:MAG: PAS domain S-box protein [Candidatus Kapabacteria bacterium]|nr:PAS domain S-box protein [Candidatus Kapabacteria bacterium]
MDRKILILINFITIIFIVFGIAANYLLNLSIWGTIVMICALFVIIYFLNLSRNSQHYKKITFPLFIISLIFLTMMWFLNGGYDGNIGYLIFVYFIAIYSVAEKKYKKTVFLSYLILYSSLVAIHYYFPQFITPYDNIHQRFVDLFVGGILYFLLLYYIIDIILKNYALENFKVNQINEELNNKNVEISNTILKLQESEHKLRESEKRYRLLIETANEGILVAQGANLKFVNPVILELTGYSHEELLTLPFLSFVFIDDQELMKTNYIQRLNGINVGQRYQIRIVKKDLSIVWIEISGGLIDWDGHPATINFVTEINDRKKAELEILKKNNELAELNASKDKFFSILAHDLKSPFNGFLGLTKMMSENINSFTLVELQDISKQMQLSAGNLYKLLENLLEWSRMQRGAIEFNPEVCSLNYLVNENLELQSNILKSKEIQFLNNIPEETEVFADIQMLNTVLRNFITNAIKFTNRKGSIEIGVINTSKQFTEIFVKDSGIGMDEFTKSNLFKVNEKVSRLGTEDEPSTGLGLLLCKDFIEKHNGSIRVESEIDKGSTFYIKLPNVNG